MNLILIRALSIKGDEVYLTGRQAVHLLDVVNVKIGDTVRIGVLNGSRTTATVICINGEGEEGKEGEKGERSVTLRLVIHPHKDILQCASPVPVVDVLMALPRPKVFDKILQYGAAMGVNRFIFVCSARVEKSYLSSPKVTNDSILTNLQIGLEQSMDTRVPQVFVYASLATCLKEAVGLERHNELRLVAHPPDDDEGGEGGGESGGKGGGDGVAISSVGVQSHKGPVMIAIGPEGGWIDREIEEMKEYRFVPFSMGSRILKVETAFMYLMGQLELLLAHDTIRDSSPQFKRDLTDPHGVMPLVQLPIKGPKPQHMTNNICNSNNIHES